MDEEKIRVVFESVFDGLDIEICDENWYVEYLVDVCWDELPEDLKKPSTIPVLNMLILDRIHDVKESCMRKIGILEDHDEDRIDYILNIDITDNILGTIFAVTGGGPGYRDVVSNLEMAAGSVMFYENRDSELVGGETNSFDVHVEICRSNGEVIQKWDLHNGLYLAVVDLLGDARHEMANIYREDLKRKGDN